MRYILTLLILSSCSRMNETEEIIVRPVLQSGFTSTEQYQIMCWVIKAHEGYRSESYRCQAGKKTKGWGFTNSSDFDDIHDADEIFKDIVGKLYKEVNLQFPHLYYLQKAAIVSLYYNTGSMKNIKNSKFSSYLENDQITKAVKSFKTWNKVRASKGKFIVSKGLVNRRGLEAKLLDGSFTMKDYDKLKNHVSKIYIANR